MTNCETSGHLRKRDEFVFDVTESLGASIRYFILAVAAREVRGQGDDHCSTMLVHTSMLNSVHRSAKRAIRPHIERLAYGLRKNDPALIRELREQWELECERVEASEFELSVASTIFEAIWFL
ncbi:Z1 domain-containing protein [Dokdonella sp.]|uniref:Z1 domain-containing protein n=1 Tax=Dokdonella sp. TaxID=2291710 RepID=UPI003527CE5F